MPQIFYLELSFDFMLKNGKLTQCNHIPLHYFASINPVRGGNALVTQGSVLGSQGFSNNKMLVSTMQTGFHSFGI